MKNYNIVKYPDGSSYIDFGEEGGDIGENLEFRINSYEDLWHLNQLVDAHRGLPFITIPNLIDAQADRRFEEFQSSGLKLVCDFLNNINAIFRIFHPHNPEVVEALIRDVEIIDNSEFILRVIKNIRPFHDVVETQNLILMSSDAGGFKPLMKLCDKLGWKGETYSASKSRSYEDGKSKLIQLIDRNDFKGNDILIIDDICVYGGTFKGLAILLKERNCGKLYLAVSHMTIQNHKNGELFELYDKVYTTNSKYNNYFIPDGEGGTQPKNLEVIRLFNI